MAGLEIHRPKPAVVGLLADRRLYLTRDEACVVEQGAPDAAFLFATPGMVIPARDADRLGLTLVDGSILLPGTAAPAAVDLDEPIGPDTPVEPAPVSRPAKRPRGS